MAVYEKKYKDQEMTSSLKIISATDNNYAQHLGVMLCSVFENKLAETIIEVYVIDGGLSEENKDKLIQICQVHNSRIRFLTVNKDLYSSMMTSHHISKTAYYRISIPDILPEDIDRVLYLDCDIIVTGDLSRLWNTDLSNSIIGAVHENGISHYSDLGLPNQKYYFNSGVLLIDLRKWRQFDTTEKVLGYLTNNHKLIKYHDQDGLNAILWNKWYELPVTYNYGRGHIPKQTNITKPVIIHYTSGAKPWIYMARRFPHDNEYYIYLKKTPWKDFRPRDKTIKNIIMKKIGIAYIIMSLKSIAYRNKFLMKIWRKYKPIRMKAASGSET